MLHGCPKPRALIIAYSDKELKITRQHEAYKGDKLFRTEEGFKEADA